MLAGASGEGSQAKEEKRCNVLFPILEADRLAAATLTFEQASDPQSNQFMEMLERNGFAVVTGVLSPQEIQASEALFGADLAELRREPAREDDPSVLEAYAQTAVSPAQLPRAWPCGTPLSRIAGFASDRGLAQGRLAWALRLNPRMRSLYCRLYGATADELCVSMDNPFFAPPSTAPQETSAYVWPHVDQNAHALPSGAWPVCQSLLYLWSSEPHGSSTTVILPGSHTHVFDTIMASAAAKEAKSHFVKLEWLHDKTHENLFCEAARRVPVPAGGALFWNSRTCHQGHRGGARLAVPICWEPKARRSDEVLRRKARLCVAGLPTTHWASLGVPHSGVTVRDATPPQAAPDGASWQHACLPLAAQCSLACVRADKLQEAELLRQQSAGAEQATDDDPAFGARCVAALVPEVAAAL